MDFGRAALERDGGRVERRRAGTDDADDLACHRIERNVAGRMRPDARRQRAYEVRHVRPAGTGVAVGEHELARGLDAPHAVGLEMQA